MCKVTELFKVNSLKRVNYAQLAALCRWQAIMWIIMSLLHWHTAQIQHRTIRHMTSVTDWLCTAWLQARVDYISQPHRLTSVGKDDDDDDDEIMDNNEPHDHSSPSHTHTQTDRQTDVIADWPVTQTSPINSHTHTSPAQPVSDCCQS